MEGVCVLLQNEVEMEEDKGSSVVVEAIVVVMVIVIIVLVEAVAVVAVPTIIDSEKKFGKSSLDLCTLSPHQAVPLTICLHYQVGYNI